MVISPRSRAGAMGVVALLLSACAVREQVEPSSAPAPSTAMLDVTCSPEGVAVSADRVRASSDGVRLQVGSRAPGGTYLTFEWPGGGGGQEVPPSGATWTLAVPPGDLTLSCMSSSDPGPAKVVTVTDPDGYWSTTTLADLGCKPGGVPSWVVGPVSGPTAQAAVDGLAAAFVDAGVDGAQGGPSRVVRALVGYTGSADEVWLISVADGPHLTARVWPDGTGFTAAADTLCR